MATNSATDTATGATGTILQGQGIGSRPAYSTAAYPATAGTSKNVLKSNGTNFLSSSFSGNLELIDTKTATNSATVSFTSGLTGYDVFLLKWTNVLNQTNGAHLTVQYSTDGGSTYSSSGYANQQGFAVGAAGGGTTTGTTYNMLILGQANGTSSLVSNGQCFFYDLLSANRPTIRSDCQANNASGYLPQYNTGYWSTTTAVNAFQLIYTSGNITQGTFKLYGVVN